MIRYLSGGSGRLIAALLVLSSASAWADSGTIVIVDGPVTVERRGQELDAPVGFAVAPGDTIRTGKQGNAQIHFVDDSAVAIPPGGAFRIDAFTLPRQHQEGIGQAVFSLLRGGFRTVSGLIGKGSRDFYEVRTQMATIGIRGTDYAALLCEGDCTKGGKYPPGLYVKAERGTVVVKNSAGKLRLRAGQVAYVAGPNTPPVLVDESPFDDPVFYAEFRIQVEFDAMIDPPRIEQEPPASPSSP